MMEMRTVVQVLIAEELRAVDSGGNVGRAAFRVCEKLRGPLCTLTGTVGFRSLLSRALTMAKAKHPRLSGLQVKPDGSLGLSVEMEAEFDTEKAAQGGFALVTQLLELLVIFIGEALTLRLVRNTWPKVPLKNSDL